MIEANKDGEEFGEQRLIEALQRSDAEPRSMLASVLETVQQYNGKEQFDDATLIIAKCKE